VAADVRGRNLDHHHQRRHVTRAQPGDGSDEGRPVDGPSLSGGWRHRRGGRSRSRVGWGPGREARDGVPDAASDIRERPVPVWPLGQGLAVLRQSLELPERGRVPVARPQDDRDDPGRPRLVTLHRPLRFHVPAIVRVKEVGTDEQQDDVCGLEVPVNLAHPLGPGTDASVVPFGDDALTPQPAEGRLELVPEELVLVRVRVEQADRGRGRVRGGHETHALRVRKGSGRRGGRRSDTDGRDAIHSKGCWGPD
jgi:hypothetical protein